MEKICLSIEEMKHLTSLGLDTSDASMMYSKYNEEDDFEVNNFRNVNLDNLDDNEEIIPAYSFQDVLKKLPTYIFAKENEDDCNFSESTYDLHIIPLDNGGLLLQYMNQNCKCKPANGISSDNWLDAAYKTLLWCVENAPWALVLL